MRTPRALVAGITAGLLLGACSAGGPTDDRGGGTTGPSPTASGSATTAPGTTTTTGTPTPGPSGAATSGGDPSGSVPRPTASAPAAKSPDPASIAALVATRYDGGNLRLGRERGSTDAYRQYFATYESNGLTISGRINIPRGTGPFPAVVLAHGYVDPKVYTNGQTMLRERDHLARRGYVTLHIDYRNHAQSDDDPRNDANLRAGYTVDAINAGLALKKAQVVDPDRVALIGRSMGGGVVYNALVVRPGLFRAAVAYAPVSSDTVDNFDKWVRRDTSRAGAARAVIARLGTPEAKPAAWAATSPRTYFGRITEPLLIHHGTADEDCPLSWSRESVAALQAAGKDVELRVYPGGRHTLTSPQWDTSIRRTEAFLARHLR
ncbi:alpha/beta fold hydrolase [Terrabacter sp. NPDC000476]|uniref:alpha/beta hydrolase family protein n=1 Tax=Terrabacter sp. NPDC000476 TaxID=3154258 RepID=UPI0033292342